MKQKRILLIEGLLVLGAVVFLVGCFLVYDIYFTSIPEGADYMATLEKVEKGPDGTLTVRVRLERRNTGKFGKVTISSVRVYQMVASGEKTAKTWMATAALDAQPPDEPAPKTVDLIFKGGPYPAKWEGFHLLFGVNYNVKVGLLGLAGPHQYTEEQSVDVKVP
jgi:hypothetical protein